MLRRSLPFYDRSAGFVGITNFGRSTGFGVLTYDNGREYKGQVRDNMKHGKGIYTSPDFSYYGDWSDDMYHGHGLYKHSSGDTYQGQWVKDEAHGHGVYTFAEGGSYTGQWADSLFQGQGIHIYPDGDKYIGEWKADKKEGHGVYFFASGDIYNGEWANDLMHGSGIYTDASGKKAKIRYEAGQRKEFHLFHAKQEVTKAGAFPEWMSCLPVDDEVRALLAKEMIDEESFVMLEENDLKEMGLPIGPRKLLWKEIKREILNNMKKNENLFVNTSIIFLTQFSLMSVKKLSLLSFFRVYSITFF